MTEAATIMWEIVQWIIPFVLGVIVAWSRKTLQKQKSLELGMQALLRDRITELYERYNGQGWCPLCARENLQALFDQYKALGGNGHTEDLVQRMMDLPTVEAWR
jgi:hypothetical protein